MRLPIIKIKDNRTGDEFIMTDNDSHDYLFADEKGIHYYNLQNGEGTGESKNCGYSFVGEEGYMGTNIPMMDMFGILSLYRDLAISPLANKELVQSFDAIMNEFQKLEMKVGEEKKKRRKEWVEQMKQMGREYLEWLDEND